MATELLPNPSFDVNGTGWLTGAQFTPTIPDVTHVQKGAGAAKATGIASTNGQWRIFACPTSAQPKEGSAVASAWIWIPAAWGSGNVAVEIYDFITGGNAGALATASAKMALRDQWQQVVCYGSFGSSSSQGIRISTSGTVVAGDLIWVDEASVTQDNALLKYFRSILRKGGR